MFDTSGIMHHVFGLTSAANTHMGVEFAFCTFHHMRVIRFGSGMHMKRGRSGNENENENENGDTSGRDDAYLCIRRLYICDGLGVTNTDGTW